MDPKGKGRAVRSDSPPLSMQRPSSWNILRLGRIPVRVGMAVMLQTTLRKVHRAIALSGWAQSSSATAWNASPETSGTATWNHVNGSTGWRDPVRDDTGDGASSSGHTDFQDPEEEISWPVSQEDSRVRVETGLVTPVDSVKHLSPSENKSPNQVAQGSKGKGVADEKKEVEHLGRGYLMVKTRRRVTVDGGRSLLAIEKAGTESQGKRHVYPMHSQSDLFCLCPKGW